jgi:predicted NBD/HSP70 family sugar kinase
MRANVVAFDELALTSLRPDDVADTVSDLVLRLAERVPSATAVGIGLGGLVSDASVVRSAPFLGWNHVPLGRMLASRTGLLTVVENDVVAYTETEHWFGGGRGLDRFAVITVGTGVGYGAVIHSKVVVGDDSGIGLVGHWPLDPFGPMCAHGHRGCADAMLASPAIAATVSSALGRNLDYDACLDLAVAGHPAARRVVDGSGFALGRLIAAVANLTVPQKLILGGEGSRLAEIAAESMERGIQEDRDPRANPINVEVSSRDVSQWCRGAAVIAIQTYVLGDHALPAVSGASGGQDL